MQVRHDDELQRVAVGGWVELAKSRLRSSRLASVPSIAAVKDSTFEQHDRMDEAAIPDAGHKRHKSRVFEQRENVGVGVGFHLGDARRC